VVETELPQRLWTDAQTNVHLLGQMRACYCGRHDVLDALWWRAHPSTRSPGGEPDPATGLPELMVEVYSRRVLSEPLTEFVDPVSDQTVRATASGRALRGLTMDLTRDAAALDAVLEQFGQFSEQAQARHVVPPGPRTADVSPPTPPHRPRTRSPRPGPPARHAAAKFAAAAVVVGVVALTAFFALTGGIGEMLLPGFGPGTSSPTAGTGSASADSTAAARDDAFRIFDTPTQYTTGIAALLGPEYLPLTMRRIPHAAAALTGLHMFAVQRTDGAFCLILLQPKDETDVACATRGSIQQHGLRLRAIVVPEDPASAYPQPFKPVDATIEWDRSGAFTAEFEPRFS
jgi:hypothetical protein